MANRLNFGPAFVEQVRRIQRPELNDRARSFLGIRAGNVLGNVADTVQPVVVVGDLDRIAPALGQTRSAAWQSADVALVAAQDGGVALACGSTTLGHSRLYLKRVRVTFVVTPGGAVPPAEHHFCQFSLHPTSPDINFLGKRTQPGTGGDPAVPLNVRSGLRADNNATGFPFFGINGFVLRGDQQTTIDLSQFVLTSLNLTGLPGGQGSALWLIVTAPIAGRVMNTVWEWDDEPYST